MAFAFTHGGWRRAADPASELILHIEEIENLIGGYERHQASDQSAARNLAALQDMLKRREDDLAVLQTAAGTAPGQSDDDPFVSVRPVE